MTLTHRQKQILTHLAAGLSETQAARALAISDRTLRRDVQAAQAALGAETTCQAVALAVAAGAVTATEAAA